MEIKIILSYLIPKLYKLVITHTEKERENEESGTPKTRSCLLKKRLREHSFTKSLAQVREGKAYHRDP